MCTPKAPKIQPAPAPEPVEKKEADLQISARKSRDDKRSTSSNQSGLNRFLIVPGSDGAGANVPN
jgi:hypothetical protein